jgi:hypothetical protein
VVDGHSLNGNGTELERSWNATETVLKRSGTVTSRHGHATISAKNERFTVFIFENQLYLEKSKLFISSDYRVGDCFDLTPDRNPFWIAIRSEFGSEIYNNLGMSC